MGLMDFIDNCVAPHSLLGRALRSPLSLIPPETRVPILQGKARGMKWIVGSSIHGCWLGNCEYSKRRTFQRTITEGSTVFDIGAHVGYYTLLASVLVGPRGHVVAFEPLPRNLSFLKAHLQSNQVTNVSIVEAGVSDHSSIACFDEGPDSSSGRVAEKGELQIRTVALDDLIADRQLRAPDYIKMDIEGGELHAMLGARSLLLESRPTIFLSTHGKGVHHECLNLLRSLGYEMESLYGKNITDVARCSEILAFFR